MSDYIGEASVRITGDIKPLQEAVKKVEQVVAPLKNKQLEGFKINYDGQQFESFQAFTDEINRQQQEWEAYTAQQHEVASATTTTAQSVSQLDEAMTQTTQNAQQTQGALSTFVNGVANIGRAVEGSLLRTKESIESAGRLGRTVLIGLGASFVALAKSSISEYAKYSEDASKKQEELSKSISKVKAGFGAMLSPILSVVAGFADWASKNQQVVNGVVTAVGVLAGGAGLIALVTKLKNALIALKTASGGVIGILSLLAGIFVASITSAQTFDKTLKETAEDEEKMAEATRKLNDTMAEVNETIAEAQKGIAEARFDYEQSLKKILITHEDTVDQLTRQIEEANKDYQKAINERNVAFLKSQVKEEEAHQNKVDELQTQLRFLQRYNNAYNQEKLAAVQFALAREEALYKKKTKAEKEELDLQNAYEKQKRDEKLASYEKELADERAFLNKHAELFKSVRNTILLDEVEMLNKQYNATVENYNKQISVARQKGSEAATAYAKAYMEASEIWSKSHDLKELEKMGYLSSGVTMLDGKPTRIYVQSLASGGYTGRGGKYEVADDVQVHRGEYVLPQEMVDQDTGTPKGLGNNITINLSGVFATSEAEQRKVAQQIVSAIQQTNYARLGA